MSVLGAGSEGMREEIAYRIKAYLYKAVNAVMEVLGRRVVINVFMPEIGRKVLDVQYGSKNRRKQSLDVFVPRSKPPYPILVYMHGSGFHVMDKKTYHRVCSLFANKGYLVVNANYRLAPACGFPGQVQDAAEAIYWAWTHASEYGGDPDNIFLAGDSAGAYLAAMYGALSCDERLASELGIERLIPTRSVRGLLLFYGAYDMASTVTTRFPFIKLLTRGFLGQNWQADPRRVALASPSRHIGEGYPPCCLFVGAWDPLCSESRQFDRVLTGAGVPHSMVLFGRKYPTANHGFLTLPFSKCSKMAIEEAVSFMRSLV
jgi:acetyl esterase/lipase